MRYPGRRQVLSYDHQPLEQHFDKGFGWMAEQFHFAAISTHNRRQGIPPKILPTIHLFVHSTELYLKSFIIVLNKLMSESDPDWLFRTHKMSKLTKELRKKHDQFQLRSTSNILKFVIEATIWTELDLMSDADYGGDYFRYPVSKGIHSRDSRKNAWTTVSRAIVERQNGIVLSNEFSDQLNVKGPNYLLEDLQRLKRVNDKLYEIHFRLRYKHCNGK